jgi:hypothetical protein
MIPNEEIFTGLPRKLFRKFQQFQVASGLLLEFLAQAGSIVEHNYVFEFAADGHVEQ